MKRNLFLKILFRKILEFSVYLFGLVLLLTIPYKGITSFFAININIGILFIVALPLAGLIFYLANRGLPEDERIKNTPLFAGDLLQLLKRRQDKERLKPEIESLNNKYKSRHSLHSLRQDLECHLGLFQSDSHDYRFKNKVYSFDEGISYYIEKLETMFRTGHFVFDESVYELYWRWMYDNGYKIEIECLHSRDKYSLYKDVNNGDYYFLFDFGPGIGSSPEIVKVSEDSLKAALKTAIQINDMLAIKQIGYSSLKRA